MRELLDHILPVTARLEGLRNDARVTSSLQRYDLERIDTRTLVISMADDLYGTFDTARYTAEHLPHARFVPYSTGGHVGVGRQHEITAEIAAFLEPGHAQ